MKRKKEHKEETKSVDEITKLKAKLADTMLAIELRQQELQQLFRSKQQLVKEIGELMKKENEKKKE